MPNYKMSNGKKCRTDKMLNETKRGIDTMSKVRKAEWDIMLNGTKRRIEIMSKVRKVDWDKISKVSNVKIRRHTVMSKKGYYV